MATSVASKLAVVITANASQMTGQLAMANKKLTAMQTSIKSVSQALIGTFGAYMVVGAIRNVVGTLAEFEKQMSKVSAISGATGSELDLLTKNALKLGETTEYTARQIASLQVEFARLGFSTKEILDSTKATLDLATATGEDLTRSAEIAGSTLRAFQLDATEMGRVTDVMTGTLNLSALALDSYANAIKYVAPVAEATNVSLEETSAMLGVLADSGIKGTMAGTSLRRIMTLLDKSGRPLAKRLQELADKGIDLAGANDEVGLYAQTALLVLAKQNDKVKELAGSLNTMGGEAKRTADIMRDNLAGDADKLTSAFEGLILKGSVLNELLRQIVQTGTGIITFFTGATDAVKEYNNAVYAFKTNGSFRDHVFGQNLEKDLAVLKEYAKVAGVAQGVQGPYAEGEGSVADMFLKKKAEHMLEIAKLTKEEWEKQNKLREKALELAYKLSEEERTSRSARHESGAGSVFGSPTLGISGNYRETETSQQLPLLNDDKIAPTLDAIESMKAAYNSLSETISKNAEISMKADADKLDSQLSYAAATAQFAAQVIGQDKDILKSAARLAQQQLAMNAKAVISWIAVGIAKAFGKTGNPVGAIVAGTVITGVVMGLLSKIGRGNSGGGGYSGGASSSGKPRAIDNGGLYVRGEFRLAGSTLIAGIDQANYQKKRLG
jgi:hypothetical protein